MGGMSPTAGMRLESDGYVNYIRGDGTEFHYTWTSTEDYRRNFNLFVWRREALDAPAGRMTVDTVDMRPLLMPDLPSFTVPVTACVYGDTTHCNLLEPVYKKYKELRATGSDNFSTLGAASSRWTMRRTCNG